MAPDASHRRVVWSVLSNLFLDTDVSELEEFMVRELRSTPYTLDEMETILAEEVYPVCCWNFWSVAGVWSGFDEAWLFHQIENRSGRKRDWLLRVMGRRFARKEVHWQKVKLGLASLEQQSTCRNRTA